MAELEQTIIIKKINKIEGGHHGGAWKVAYADFVTAMMAFFLLMWLLSSASEAQLEGISDYFTPTVGLQGQKGIGFEGGQTAQVDGTKKNDMGNPAVMTGALPEGVKPGEPTKKSVVDAPDGEDLLFEKGASAITQLIAQHKELSQMADNVRIQQTPEGLKLQISDTDEDDVFEPGKSELTIGGQRMLRAMAGVINGMPNLISIVGHTDSTNYGIRRSYTNWELSSARANTARRFMIRSGMSEDRVAKVGGRADKELLYPMQPKHPKNRRIEITLLSGQYMGGSFGTSPVHGIMPISNDRDDIIRYEDESTAISLDTLEEKETSESLGTAGASGAPNPTDALNFEPDE